MRGTAPQEQRRFRGTRAPAAEAPPSETAVAGPLRWHLTSCRLSAGLRKCRGRARGGHRGAVPTAACTGHLVTAQAFLAGPLCSERERRLRNQQSTCGSQGPRKSQGRSRCVLQPRWPRWTPGLKLGNVVSTVRGAGPPARPTIWSLSVWMAPSLPPAEPSLGNPQAGAGPLEISQKPLWRVQTHLPVETDTSVTPGGWWQSQRAPIFLLTSLRGYFPRSGVSNLKSQGPWVWSLSSGVYRAGRYRAEVGALFHGGAPKEPRRGCSSSGLRPDLAVPSALASASANPAEAPPSLTLQAAAPPLRPRSDAGRVLNIVPSPCSNLFPVWTVPQSPHFPCRAQVQAALAFS